MITAAEYGERRRRLMERLALPKAGSKTAVIVRGATSPIMSNDIPYRFRQDSCMRYLCGYHEAGALLLIESDPGTCDRTGTTTTTLVLPPRDPHKEKWDGARTSNERVLVDYGIDAVAELDQLDIVLTPVMITADLLFYDFNNSTMPSADLHNQVLDMAKMNGVLFAGPVGRHVDQLRVVKSDAEIAIMRRVCQISVDSFKDAMMASSSRGGTGVSGVSGVSGDVSSGDESSGVSEHFLDAVVEFGVRQRGASSLAFPPVVAGGNRANTLHYIRNDAVVKDGELVLMDAGAEYIGYCGDISRTWPVNGRFSPPQALLYGAVLRVQEHCIKACRADGEMTLLKLHSLSLKLMGDELTALGVIPTSLSNEAKVRHVRKYYPHSIGHYLGMDVHDTSTHSLSAAFVPGMVVTVEPGLYIAEDALDAPERFRGIGIRIEDDVLITADGPCNLTERCPKSVRDVEAAIGCRVSH